MQPDPVHSTKINSENGRFYEARIDDISGEKVGICTVYDGHGGVRAAEYVKQHLFGNLIKHPKFITDTKAAIAETYNLTDSEFLKADSRQTRDAGSTAIGDCLLVANVGDSRAIISKGGQAIAVSRDHKPDETDERQRIEDAGGFAMWAGTWRVGGVLSVSLAFGDKLLKQYVVADSEINSVLNPTNTKRNHVRKGIFMLSRAHNGGSSSEGISNTLSGGNNHYRETDSAYNNMPKVILDNQAQSHCTGNFEVLSNLSYPPENIVLVAANQEEMETFMCGSVLLGNCELHDVRYCPDLGDIIIVSGSMLDNDDYEYKFGQGKFTVKDLKNDTTVGEGRLIDGDYIVDYLKIPRDRTRAREQTGLVTTVWNSVCSALHRLGLKY